MTGVTSPVGISANNPGAPTGATLCIDIAVEDFDDLIGLQYTMHWDPTLFQFQGTQGYNLPDLAAGNFNNLNNSTLTFSWNEQSTGAGITLADGTVIYQVCFTVLGPGGSVSDFTFDGNPTVPEASGEGLSPTNQINFTNGTLNVTGTGGGANSVILTAESTSADPGSNFCIPITAESFDDIIAFQYSMNWDPSILMFTGTQNYNANLIALGPSSFNNSEPGVLRTTWNNPSNLPITLNDGETLYEICFDVIGSAGQIGTVSFSDMPLDIEITDSNGPNVILSPNSASITITNAGGFNVNPSDVNACPDDGTVCVPFIVTGFNQIAGTQWTVEFDPTILDFDQTDMAAIQNVAPGVLGLVNVSFNETALGSVRFSWNDPIGQGVTLQDNSTYFEMCFDIIGDLGTTTNVAITGSNASVEVSTPMEIITAGVGSATVNVTCDAVGGPAIDVSASAISDASCGDTTDGSINVSVSGGQAPLEFAWSPNTNDNTQSVSNLAPGTYTVTITDDNGATTSESFTIASPPAINASANATSETATAAGDGTITLTVSGGTPDYTYLWSDGQTTQNLTGLSPDTYTVTITDDNNCTMTASATVGTAITIGPGNPPGGPTGSTVVNDVNCNGDNDGAIDLVFSGGVSPFTYSWDNGSTDEDLSNLAPATYCVTVTDANNSSAEGCFTITEPDAITIDLVAITNASAEGFSDGSIDVTVTGGTGNMFYTWVPIGSTSTPDLTDQAAGTYTLTVVDGNMCSATSSPYTIEDGPAILMFDNDNTTTQSACADVCNGQITVAVTGGQAPFTYAWENGTAASSSNVITGLCPGNYQVTVTDATDAQTISPVINVAALPAITLTATITDESTNGANDGAVDLTVSGGSPNYTYSWSNNMTTQDISGLAPSNYIVTVTDARGCTESETFTVISSVPPVQIVGTQSVITDVSCNGGNDGAIDVALSGGLAPFSFSWTGGQPSQEDISNLTAGTYSLTVTDDAGNSATQSFIVGQAAAIQITCTTIPETSAGGDGGINVAVTGGTPGYTYEWFTADGTSISNSQNIANQTAGTFRIEVTDANGCVDSEICTIQGIFGASQVIINDVDCFGNNTGSINITTFGGRPPYSWIWRDSENNIVSQTEDLINRPAGTYTITMTDDAGQTFMDTYIINEPSMALTIANAVLTDEIAPDLGAINVSVQGGTPPYSYNWSNGATTEDLSNMEAGCYAVTVIDANQCLFFSEEYCLEYQPIQISVTGSMTSQPSCNGDANGAIMLNIDGGDSPYTIEWLDNSVTLTQSVPIDYTITNLPAGSYEPTITDNNGQVLVLPAIEVTEPDPISITPTVTAITDCPGNGSISLNGMGTQGGTSPYTYLWLGPNAFTAQTPIISNLSSPGTYSVTITDANDCTFDGGSIDVIMDVPELSVSLGSNSVTSIGCPMDADGSIDLVVTGGFCPDEITYIWNTGDETQDLDNLIADTYTVTIVDGDTEIVETFDVTAQTDLSVENAFVTTQPSGMCDGTASIVVNSSNGVTITWCDGQTGPNASGFCPGQVCEIMVMDVLGCAITTSVTFEDVIGGPLGVNPLVDTACGEDCDGAIDLNPFSGTAPYSFVWGTPGLGNVQFIDALCPGDYAYTITDANGQSINDVVTVAASELTLSFETEKPSMELAEDGAVTVNVAGGSGQYVYQWNDTNAQTSARAVGLGAGNYCVVVSDIETGCMTSACMFLDDNSADCLTARNIITPNNGDDKNDKFIITCLDLFETNTLEIYNRWGQLVIDYQDYGCISDNNSEEECWTGKNRRDIDLPEGAYFYVLRGTYLDGSPEEQIKGHITILRE